MLRIFSFSKLASDKPKIYTCILALCFLPILTSGCAYTTKLSLDPKYQTVAVVGFYNKSSEYDIQAPLTNALIRKFITDGRLKVVKPEEADLLIEGVLLDYQRKGLTYDVRDETTQFLIVLTAGVRVTDQKTGKILWQDQLIAGESTFFSRAAGQSSDRLRGNVEAYLLPVRSFPSDEENRAVSEAIEQLASDIFYRTVEPW
ncbi:MAG: LPS assembly lipoprotein LptE [Candidatus Hydrogenedentes bacterium]|nr:LPS assembly lipoprotein LptE [Candidatus Hydrogenedentota bacterium]